MVLYVVVAARFKAGLPVVAGRRVRVDRSSAGRRWERPAGAGNRANLRYAASLKGSLQSKHIVNALYVSAGVVLPAKEVLEQTR